jgi:hypothetical protein
MLLARVVRFVHAPKPSHCSAGSAKYYAAAAWAVREEPNLTEVNLCYR